MKAPEIIRCGGILYKILYAQRIKKGLMGDCDHDKALIQVSQDQALESMKSTLLHEAIHAAAHAIDWKAKEATVIKIEKMMFALLRDNKEFIERLNERPKEV